MKRSAFLLALVAIALVVWGAFRLRFDADALNLLPSELPVVRGLQWHQKYFAGSQELLITLEGNDPDRLAGNAREIVKRLGARPDLVRAIHAFPPWIEHPADAAENLAWLWLQQPPSEFSGLVGKLAPGAVEQRLVETRELLATALDPSALARSSYDPLGLSQLPGTGPPPGAGMDDGVGTFQNADGTFRLIHVEPAADRFDYRAAAAWLAEVRREVNSISNPPAVAFTGGPVFLAEIASGMERDLINSVLTTIAVISVLFWLAHRSLRPLLGLVAALVITLAGTLALGGLVFGTLNVISAGFAAVLLGLVVDYGLVGYQEARAHPELSLEAIRRRAGPGIAWSAVTTAGTFALLRWAGLPGLAQLGTLTALGLLLGAVVMVFGFLPFATRGIRRTAGSAVPPPTVVSVQRQRRWGLGLTAILLLLVFTVLIKRGWPKTTGDTTPLRPRQSQAYSAMEELQARLGRTNDPLWLLVSGTTAEEVADSLATTDAVLAKALAQGEVASYALPRTFWPRPNFARTNLALAAGLVGDLTRFRTAVLHAGFTPQSMQLNESIFAAWRQWSGPPGAVPLWPTNSTSHWIRRQFAAQDRDGHWLALGFVDPGTKSFSPTSLPPGVLVSGWDQLGSALLQRVSGRVRWLTGLIVLFIASSLLLAFRRWVEVVIGMAALVMAIALLLAVMSALGTTWNLLSLVAIPLILGSSVDSTIHVQLALRRGVDWNGLYRTTGRALVLCAGANVAGFGSLAWSNNAGLASLDLVCAGGVLCVLLVALGLMPSWWWSLAGPLPRDQEDRAHNVTQVDPLSGKLPISNRPSFLYTGPLWKLGSRLICLLPRSLAMRLARFCAWIYCQLNPARVRTVEVNLRPLVEGSAVSTKIWGRRNFSQFAMKLVDLWRFEAGEKVSEMVKPGFGWEHFHSAKESGRGILLVTPHLGNWEFGAVLLREMGIRPLVLTAVEPGVGFTELRAQARARQEIDTLVVGTNPFAFVEVIRRLQDGGVVAVLLDRPAAATAVTVELCGRPFSVSVAAAELARASGCVVLPTYIVREGSEYRAYLLPPIAYEQSQLTQKGTRVALTGQIVRAFEPILRQYPDQWFHFVPVWPEAVTNQSDPGAQPPLR